ncbi:hypothetical protein AAF712_005485 [Marasmius tenuissimus]|uniref:Uncharacterized protein n=1 Tax=Marasmius tenuissimus TaxID=585030 RepID=A0ABR3A3A2_9AGAR
MYNLHYELEMRPHKKRAMRPPQGLFSHPDYPTCILLPPSQPFMTVPPFWHEKIKIGLATHFDTTVTEISKYYQPEHASQWGKVRRLDAGNDMKASSLVKAQEDTRDAMWIKYDMLVDIHASRRGRRPQFVTKTFYGQLMHIFVVSFLATPALNVESDMVLILAGIH